MKQRTLNTHHWIASMLCMAVLASGSTITALLVYLCAFVLLTRDLMVNQRTSFASNGFIFVLCLVMGNVTAANGDRVTINMVVAGEAVIMLTYMYIMFRLAQRAPSHDSKTAFE
ncbi:hypothetical protein CWE21_10125 [Pseudidiomarina aquimaris]|uniref:Uncharacterized protein n=1 Tax=Pseudidiomarina aquimaris TaxID=641841 RepID=A0A432XDX5_9GAMM|nr:hypothetical protein [Pseudidiomarina aquimaris]RUO46949.1 hypothetical protein CWE21_10125 [Pseudidiomarina aquimaris]